MSLFIFDTNTLTLLGRRHATVLQHASAHPPTDLAVTVISLDEMLSGWYSVLRRAGTHHQLEQAYDRLARIVEDVARLPTLRFSVAAIVRFESLVRLRLNVGHNDLRIAAIALEAGSTVVTGNLRDFQRVPGLPCVDWSV